MHEQVLQLAAGGQTAQEIIDRFVREHGVQILMAPPKRGFNLAGYFLPTALILAAAALLVLALRRWARTPASPGAAGPAGPVPSAVLDASSAELERLRRELDRLPG
jgi:cytochrome c-type biogenesis protein CcmH/NrfF